jgi:hypothetical protein
LDAGFTKEEILAAGMQFNIERFNSSNVMSTSATAWEGMIPETINYDATAVFYMSQTIVQQIFCLKLVGNLTNFSGLTDFSDVAITYFTNMNKWPTNLQLNPSNAMLDATQSFGAVYQSNTSEKMLVKHDFIRYLSLKLFGSPQGADLFNNEASMIQSLNVMGNSSFQQDISSVLWDYSSTNPHPQLSTDYVYDASLNLYGTTDTFKSNENICRELFQQLLFENIDRFSLLTKNSDGLYPIPIITGDTISFTYTIHPSPNQNVLTGVNALTERTYKIMIIIDNGSGMNTTPTD